MLQDPCEIELSQLTTNKPQRESFYKPPREEKICCEMCGPDWDDEHNDESDPEMGECNADQSPKHRVGYTNPVTKSGVTIQVPDMGGANSTLRVTTI